MAGDAGHMTCTLEVVGSNVNDNISAHKGKALSTNTIRTLLSIDCAGRPSSAATGSRQRRPRMGGLSPSSRPCGGPWAFRRHPPRCRRPPRPSEACSQGSCSISPGHRPPIRGNGGEKGHRRRRRRGEGLFLPYFCLKTRHFRPPTSAPSHFPSEVPTPIMATFEGGSHIYVS